jgi:pimeloyl-ACP methyl ester carboxylesterase
MHNHYLHDLHTAKNSTNVLLNSALTIAWTRVKDGASQAIHKSRWLVVRAASNIAPQFVLKRASALFIKPQRYIAPAAEQRVLATATAFTVACKDVNIAAWRFGSPTAPVVICSHGWSGRGGQFRAFVEPLCAAGYQLVVFDHLGHGQSSGRSATLVDFWLGLEALWAHFEDQQIPVAGLLGHSLGAAAVACCLRRPLNRKPSNTRIGSAPEGRTAMPKAILIAPPDSLIGFSKWFRRFTGISEKVRAAMQWRFEQETGVKWQEFELPQSVSTIQAKALVIHDADDDATSPAGGLAIAKIWPDARFLETQGLGHLRILRNKAVLQACVDFLNGTVEFAKPLSTAAEYADVLPNPAPLY